MTRLILNRYPYLLNMLAPARLLLLLGISLSAMMACSSDGDKEEGQPKSQEYKLPSKGGVLEIVLVVDTNRFSGALGIALKDVFEEAQPGLPRGESRFRLIEIAPQDFSRFLKRHHNVLFAVVLNDNSRTGAYMKKFFTPATLEMIKQDENKFMFAREDEFAKGQQVLYLFGETQDELIENIRSNKAQLQEYFYRSERKRLRHRVFGQGIREQKRLSKMVKEETGLDIKIPSGFQLVKTDSNFLWVRKRGQKYDWSILVTYGNYSSQEMFTDSSIVKWRNFFGFKFINDTTRNESFMSTQDDVIPIESRAVGEKGLFVKEYRGLWKLKNNTRGGPFLGYAFIDKAQKRFYYIEGFLYAPNEKQKRPMFELETILRSFKVNP